MQPNKTGGREASFLFLRRVERSGTAELEHPEAMVR
ncbi:hypothetical protein AGR7C_Cc150158 [Agrobacterium deltaense Zutra 3/1]|uniref:Uncharacterized protein n=1 Tax=Agrobacterium deltaense Zutra 3/1 TaxID=1183427 RepID=A0A1S7PGL4_9HYPH|nr:hypothetical protein AGR7C_Cc150158 [Agrobacterium deltaense Zutra 3/1]